MKSKQRRFSGRVGHTVRQIASALHDTKGSALIEFGVAAPLLAFMIMIVVDSSRGFIEKSRLEAAAARSIEMVGASNVTGSDYSSIEAEAVKASGQPPENVKLTKWLECNQGPPMDFDGTCQDDEERARYLSVVIRGTYKPMFNAQALAAMYGGTGMGSSVALEGDAMVRLQ